MTCYWTIDVFDDSPIEEYFEILNNVLLLTSNHQRPKHYRNHLTKSYKRLKRTARWRIRCVLTEKQKLPYIKCFSRVRKPGRVLLAGGQKFWTMFSLRIKGRLCLRRTVVLFHEACRRVICIGTCWLYDPKRITGFQVSFLRNWVLRSPSQTEIVLR